MLEGRSLAVERPQSALLWLLSFSPRANTDLEERECYLARRPPPPLVLSALSDRLPSHSV